MEVGDSNDQYFVIFVPVNNTVGKSASLTPPRSFRARMPCLRKPGDPVQCLHYLGEELIAQTGQFLVVEPDCFVQFDFRDFEKSNSHLFIFGQDFFEGNGLEFSRFVGIEAAFRFPGPQFGNRLIGLIQARQQTIHQIRFFKRI